MHRYQCKEKRIMNYQQNMTTPKEQNKALVTDPKEMEINKLSDR